MLAVDLYKRAQRNPSPLEPFIHYTADLRYIFLKNRWSRGLHLQELVSLFGVLPVLFPKSFSGSLHPLEINLLKLLERRLGDFCL